MGAMDMWAVRGVKDRVRVWSMVFLPCLLWSCLPPWEDVCMVSTFVVTQLVFYTLSNVRGMLFLSTLVLILWTKHIFKRWYRSQVLTGEFFKNLLYLVLTMTVSVLAVLLLWMPLYEAYGCVADKLDHDTARWLMGWRNSFFLVLGAVLVTSAAAQTDIVLKPSRVYNCGLPYVVQKGAMMLGRGMVKALRTAIRVLRASRRSLSCVFTELGAALPSALLAKRHYQRRASRDDGCDGLDDGCDGRDDGCDVSEGSSTLQHPAHPPATRHACLRSRPDECHAAISGSDLSSSTNATSSTSSTWSQPKARGQQPGRPRGRTTARLAEQPGTSSVRSPTTRSQTRLLSMMEDRTASRPVRTLRHRIETSAAGRLRRRCPNCED